MPPKTKFNKENIIEAAFEIAKENGFSAITARSVAKRLGSSVAPIYVNFETIENLIESVVQRVFAISNELMAKQTGPNIFENIGKASLLSAMVANGHIPPWLNERDVEELLMKTGEDLLLVQKIKRGKNKQ